MSLDTGYDVEKADVYESRTWLRISLAVNGNMLYAACKSLALQHLRLTEHMKVTMHSY